MSLICFFLGQAANRVGSLSKKTMYVRSIYNDWYTKTNALKRTPYTADEWCWTMSFLGCQVRALTISSNLKKVTDIKESKEEIGFRATSSIPSETSLYAYVPITNLQYAEQIRQFTPHLFQLINDQAYVVVFNPYKKYKCRVNNVYEYYLDDASTVGELNAWVSAAQIVHTYVEEQIGAPVNRKHFGECGEAYSKVFYVMIHVLRVECQLQQSHLFQPSTIQHPPHVSLEKHIYLVFGDGEGNPHHCHAVTHRRKMIHRAHIENDIGVANYCDYCFKFQESKHQSKSDGMKHISECRAKHCVENGRHPQLFLRSEYYDKKGKDCTVWKFGRGSSDDTRKCNLCHDIVPKERLELHRCTIPLPSQVPEKEIPELSDDNNASDLHPNYWVYDIESAQVACTDTSDTRYEHVPNCICLRPVYLEGPEDRFYFETKESFCEFLLSEKRLEGATIFAHNGGSYDHQFVVQYLEKNVIPYSCLPRPGSSHKYLEVMIPRGTEKEYNIHFKDFFVFMPYSLKQIAKSFQLSIQKGDFPHLFNNGLNDQYLGPLPSLEMYSPNQLKSVSDQEEVKEWYLEQTEVYCTCAIDYPCVCTKKKWSFQEEIQKYCWLDTDILAESIAIFRREHIKFGDERSIDSMEWQPTPIDPLNYLTQAGAALHFFLQGHTHTRVRPAITERRLRSGYSKKSIVWLEDIMRQQRIYIQHAGNSHREYFDHRAKTFSRVDGYFLNPQGGRDTVYEFLGCFWHACPHCHGDKIQTYTHIHPVRNIPWKVIYDKTVEKLQKLSTVYHVEHIWEHEFHTPVSDYDNELMNVIDHREMFCGGRTEVFSPYAKATEEDSIQYHDVTSMYPAVCASKMMPIGNPTIFFGESCDRSRLHPQHRDRYFGYIRCRVEPHPDCLLGLLPEHKENKLIFDVKPKIGVWFSEEIYLAMQNGYRVTHLFEVFHFDANNRSDTYFRGYMSFFMRIKQESEGWKKAGASCDHPSPEEQQQVIERLYVENNKLVARMRPECVAKNEVRRALAKLNLNCLWGKFGQNDEERTKHTIISSYDKWVKEVHGNVMVDRESIRYRQMPGGVYMCYYKEKKETITPNAYVNVWICSAVTSWSRIILHSQMLKIGPERILYCDTDSIVFYQARTDDRVLTSRGLGNWANEMESGNCIDEFIALAPKTYMLVTRHTPTGVVKAKGVRMTISNQVKTTKEILKILVEEYCIRANESNEPTQLFLDHMTIYSNSMDVNFAYATVFTRYAKKVLRVVVSKRLVVPFPPTSQASLVHGEVTRLFTAPFSSRYVLEHPFFSQVYDKFK